MRMKSTSAMVTGLLTRRRCEKGLSADLSAALVLLTGS
jgi:hypothetical protein